MLQPEAILQGRYRIIRQIGRGGMGAVYLATDQRLRCHVALKETFFTDEAYRRAFEREAQLLARLRHSALPRVIDHFIENNGQFLVMEFIHGEDLDVRLRRQGGRFTSPEAIPWILRWADQLLDVLNYLHTRPSPIVHRDLKPKNIKLSQNYDLILLDFGLARGGFTYASPTDETALANNNNEPRNKIYGFTPPYAPLEQMRDGQPDPRSDIYSFGATIYHLLTNSVPIDAMNRMAQIMEGRPDPLRPAHELFPHVPVEFSMLVRQTMSLTMDGRPISAQAVRDELQRLRNASTATGNGAREMSRQAAALAENMAAMNQAASAAANPAPPQGPAVSSLPQTPAPVSQPVGAPSVSISYGGESVSQVSASVHAVSNGTAEQPHFTVTRQLTTGSPIRCLSFNRSGAHFAAGYEDQTIGVWRSTDHQQVHTLRGHSAGVRSVAFSPDERLIASGGEDEMVRIWDSTTGEPLRQLHVPGCSVESVQFSPDGHLIAVGGWGSAITICEVDHDRLEILSTLPSDFVLDLAFSPNGEFLAAGGYDGQVHLWQVMDHSSRPSLVAHNTFVVSVAFSPDGRWMAASGGNSIRVWRVEDFRAMEFLEGHSAPIRSVAFSPDGRFLASASEDKSVRLWEVGTGLDPTILSHTSGVTSLSFHPDGHLLASGSHDTKIRMWKL